VRLLGVSPPGPQQVPVPPAPVAPLALLALIARDRRLQLLDLIIQAPRFAAYRIERALFAAQRVEDLPTQAALLRVIADKKMLQMLLARLSEYGRFTLGARVTELGRAQRPPLDGPVDRRPRSLEWRRT